MTDVEDAPTSRSTAEAVLRPYVASTALAWGDLSTPWREVEGTMVSADISGFTALAERLAHLGREGAEELTHLLNGRFTAMIAWVHGLGGDVLKFGGDALLCLFEGDDHAHRAVQASLGMRGELEEPVRSTLARAKVQLSVSTGVHSGDHHLYMVELGGHHELIVTGPGASATVNAESAAGKGEIRVTPSTAALVRKDFDLSPADANTLVLTGVPLAEPPTAPEQALATLPTPSLVPGSHREALLSGVFGDDDIGQHRRCAVGFVYFKGVDALATSRGEPLGRVHEALSTVGGRLAESCAAAGVDFISTDVSADGGKLIVASGAMSSTDDNEGACLAAVVPVVHEHGEGILTVRAGVNSGPIFVGALGAPDRRAFTVMGDPVNLAARLMSAAAPGEVYVARETLERAALSASATPLEPFHVKGKAEPVQAVRVDGLDGGSLSATGSEAAISIEGRGEELSTILGAWQLAKRGMGQTVAVLAESGMGRGQLVAAACERADTERVVEVQAQSHWASQTLGLATHLLEAVLGIAIDASTEDRRSALLELLASGDGVGRHVGAVIAPLLGISQLDLGDGPRRVKSEFGPQVLAQAFVDVLRVGLGDRTIIAIRDVQLADVASRELLDVLAREAEQRPWLVLLTGRSGAVVPPGAHVMELGPLPDEVIRDLVSREAPRALTDQQIEQVVRRAGGNPMFAMELARVDHGGELPESIDAALIWRLDRAAPEVRRYLMAASILGERCDLELLHRAFPDLVEPGDGMDEFATITASEMVFVHGLVRDACYEAVPFRTRRKHHGRVAEVLEEMDAGPAELAHHHYVADTPEAWKWCVLAGEDAEVNFASASAVEHYRRATAVARRKRHVPKLELARVTEQLADVAEVCDQYDVAEDALKRALRSFSPNLVAEARLARKRGVILERRGQYDKALRMYRRAMKKLAERAGEAADALSLELQLAYAGIRYRQGEYLDADTWARRAAEQARVRGDARSLAHGYLLMFNTRTFTATSDNEDYGVRALALFRRSGDALYEAHMLNNLGIEAYFAGNWTEAKALYEEAAERYTEVGDIRSEALAWSNVAEVLNDQGDLAGAERRFLAAQRSLEAIGYAMGAPVTRANLGLVEVHRGHHAEAEKLLTEAREEFRAMDSGYYVMVCTVRLAALHVDAARADLALRELESLDESLLDAAQVLAASRVRIVADILRGVADPSALAAFAKEAQESEALYEAGLALRLLSATGEPDAAEQASELLDALGVWRSYQPPGYRAVLELMQAISAVDQLDADDGDGPSGELRHA